MARALLTFCVENGNDGWLQVSGTWGPRASAAQFAVHAEETVSERGRIDVNVHTLAGGPVAWHELVHQRDALTELLDAEIGALGRPSITSDGDSREATDDEWRKYIAMSRYLRPTPVGDAWRAVMAMIERVVFMARWPVLVVTAPEGWRTLQDLDQIPGGATTIDHLIRAINRAGEEHTKGKGPPSPS